MNPTRNGLVRVHSYEQKPHIFLPHYQMFVWAYTCQAGQHHLILLQLKDNWLVKIKEKKKPKFDSHLDRKTN